MRTNVVYQGDCIQGLKLLPDKSVDCIITDPPYPMDTENGTNRFKFKVNKKGSKESHLTDKNLNWFPTPHKWDYLWETSLLEMKRVLKDGGHIYIFINEDNLFKEKTRIDKYFKFRSLLTWFKGSSYSQCFGMGCYWRKSCEFVYFYTKGKTEKYIIDHGTLLHYPRNNIKINHPTPKSEKMIMKILEKSTDKEDIVLDPFMGSGTTALACKQLNRRWVGFEINPEYCKIIQKRLSQKVITGFFDTQADSKNQSFNKD